jgi:glycosyltransferase involved in cell wall biosynthesis
LRPFNIMFVTPAFVYGGLERVILDLVAALDRGRFRPMICSLYPPAPGMVPRLEAAGVPFFALDKGDGVNLRLPFQLARLFRRERVDLVNAHDIGATFYAGPAARLVGIQRVVHTDHSQVLGLTRRLSIFGAVLRYGTARATTVSDHLRQFLVETLHYPAARVQVIPNGMDLSVYEKPATDRRAEFGFSADDRVIGAIGRLTEQKGMIHLVRALPALRETHPGARLLIVGDGSQRAELETEAARFGMGGRVTLTGNRDDIPDLLRLMDVFALPSLWEGQPLVLIEAMAAGTPIVATDVGGVSEVLGSGKYGVLIPAADPVALSVALQRILDDPATSRRTAAEARAHAFKNLTHSAMARQYETLFESMLVR